MAARGGAGPTTGLLAQAIGGPGAVVVAHRRSPSGPADRSRRATERRAGPDGESRWATPTAPGPPIACASSPVVGPAPPLAAISVARAHNRHIAAAAGPAEMVVPSPERYRAWSPPAPGCCATSDRR